MNDVTRCNTCTLRDPEDLTCNSQILQVLWYDFINVHFEDWNGTNEQIGKTTINLKRTFMELLSLNSP